MNRIPAGGRLGRYQIERMLGAGAMGEVYLAEDPQIGRRVAIKTVRVEEGRAAEVEERKRRLLREARAAGRLLHPHVVALFDAGEDQGVLYLAFECVEGTDLARRLEEDPPITLREALSYVRQAAEGLDYAHRQGIVHRDIKPSNLLLGPNGLIKVSDFGIAKLSEQTSDLTMTGSVVGSPHYLSPEQIRGDELDGRSDIFSLGVLFYEILSKLRPFTGETLTTLVYQILHRDPPSVVVHRPELGTRLEGVLQKMLQKDRDQRFASAGEVARALALCEAEIPAAVLDRPAAPPDAPPLDGTRRMSTSERAAEVVPTVTGAPPPAGASPLSLTQAQTARMGSAGAGAAEAAAPPRAASAAGAARSSKSGLILIAVVVIAVLGALVAGGLAARKWASGIQKQAQESLEAKKPAQVEPEPAAVKSSPGANRPEAPVAPAAVVTPPAADPGQRYRQEPATVAESPAVEDAAPDREPVVIRRETRPEPARPTVTAPAPPAADPEPEPEPEPVPPVAERPGIAPQIDRVVQTGMSLSFVVEPEDAIVKIDNRVIGQAWTWNAKKKDGRAYDLPDAGDHLVRILKDGKTYTIRVIASESAPAPTIIAVDLEGGGSKPNRRRRDRN